MGMVENQDITDAMVAFGNGLKSDTADSDTGRALAIARDASNEMAATGRQFGGVDGTGATVRQRTGGGRRDPLRRFRYWTGENAAGIMILFCLRQQHVAAARRRPRARRARLLRGSPHGGSRLSYGQMCM